MVSGGKINFGTDICELNCLNKLDQNVCQKDTDTCVQVPWAEAAVRPQGGGGWLRVRDNGQPAQVTITITMTMTMTMTITITITMTITITTTKTITNQKQVIDDAQLAKVPFAS